MILVEDALRQVLDAISPLEPIEVPLADARGLVLAEDVLSGLDIPPLDNSAMDGYAVRGGRCGPRQDRQSGYVAGDRRDSGRVAAGAWRPAKHGGAHHDRSAPPPPALTRLSGLKTPTKKLDEGSGGSLAEIAVRVSVPNGASVRRAGEDVRTGEIVLTKGTPLGAAQLGVLASLGHARALVHRRPVVAVLASGNEITPPGQELPPGHIYDINTYTAQGLAQDLGATVTTLGIAGDDRESLTEHIRKARHADLLVTSAGVSAGYYDLVKDVLAAHGDLRLWSVKMRPGKPVAFGVLRGGEDEEPWPKPVPQLGLPGNPVSAMVVFHIFARPALRKMMGYTEWDVPGATAVLDEPIHNEDGRRVYARAFVVRGDDGRLHARLSGPQGSNILTAMARANGLAICPEDVTGLPAGSHVKVEMLGPVPDGAADLTGPSHDPAPRES